MSRHARLAAVSMAGLAIVYCLCMTQSVFAGSVVAWGANWNGETIPPEGNDFVAIAAGESNSLALKSDGSIVSNIRNMPPPPVGNDFVAIAAGGEAIKKQSPSSFSLALKSDGSIVGWGSNVAGVSTPPVGNDFVAIAAGHNHSMALKGKPCEHVLVGDLNDDCRVDFSDFALIASNWLIDCDLNPENPACVLK